MKSDITPTKINKAQAKWMTMALVEDTSPQLPAITIIYPFYWFRSFIINEINYATYAVISVVFHFYFGFVSLAVSKLCSCLQAKNGKKPAEHTLRALQFSWTLFYFRWKILPAFPSKLLLSLAKLFRFLRNRFVD